MKKSPICDYEAFAQEYAETRDKQPIHLYYERPHTWSLLPKSLDSLNILDIGCGSGWYAEELIKSGAHVTALDVSQTMVELTKKRVQGHGRFIVANLEEPLDYFKDAEFDIVLAPLVIHYIEDWNALFKEISRITKQCGLFIFSTHQPHTEYHLFNLNNYYEKVIIKDYWQDLDKEISFYHHTLHEMFENLYSAGFVIERMLEPQPLPQMKIEAPDMYTNITLQPWFLFVKARKLR